jgi:hypothetical protein
MLVRELVVELEPEEMLVLQMVVLELHLLLMVLITCTEGAEQEELEALDQEEVDHLVLVVQQQLQIEDLAEAE